MRKSIMLTSVQDAEEFVNIAAKCNFNIKVKKSCHHLKTDGKSILGMMAILGRDRLDVTYDGEDPEFVQLLEKFQVTSVR